MTYRRTGQGRRGVGAGNSLRPVSQYADFITDCRLPIDPPRFGLRSSGTRVSQFAIFATGARSNEV